MALPRTGGPIVRGEERLMATKQHGSTATVVQNPLRWGVANELADRICSFNRDGAEPSMYFTECLAFTKEIGWQRGKDMSQVSPIVFYDSVSGHPCFVAPKGRSMDDFLSESLRHGWPSFRQEEVCWDHVRILEGLEVVSTSGTHLGHEIPDSQGPRFCINLSSVAGMPGSAASDRMDDSDGAADEASSSSSWPLLRAIAAAGSWRGRMHYGTGASGMTPAPFVLEGTTVVRVSDGGHCTFRSTVTLPNGAERTVEMEGQLGEEPGAVARLDRVGDDGPIFLLLSEHTEARTILLREVNATSGDAVLTSSMVLLEDAPLEVIMTSHELTQPGGVVSGVQMWRMVPEQMDGAESPEHDEEAFMYSGSEL